MLADTECLPEMRPPGTGQPDARAGGAVWCRPLSGEDGRGHGIGLGTVPPVVHPAGGRGTLGGHRGRGRRTAGRGRAGDRRRGRPGFYVALELVGDGQCCRPGLPYAPLTQAIVRGTATGAALATITAPHPYGTFIGVTAAADNRTFVLAAQELAQLPLTTPPATRLFLLRIDPAGRVLAGRSG